MDADAVTLSRPEAFSLPVMTIIKLAPGQYVNSRAVEREISCPGGTFHRFTRSYLQTLALFYDKMPEVRVSDTQMIVKFKYTSRTYTLV
jgi:hypothetical protein